MSRGPTYLEQRGLPVLELAALAKRESRRPRPIYMTHKWFARRLGTVFRALLVGTACSPEDHYWNAYYGDATLAGSCVLDPFVGGGTSVVEAQRLGATVTAVDVDPVACAITSLELTANEIPDLTQALRELQAGVGERLRAYHAFQIPGGGEYPVVHHFWVQEVSCKQCSTKFHAHPNYQLARDANHQWVICQHCGNIEIRLVAHRTFGCTVCKRRTVIANGRVKYGRAICPVCKYREPLIEYGRRTGVPPAWNLFAVEVLLEPDGGRPVPLAQRAFFSATEDSQEQYRKAAAEYRQRQKTHPDTLPDNRISVDMRFDSRLPDYGYRCWTDLFNDRQLLHLSLTVEAIRAFDTPIRDSLAIIFSDHLTTNCMLTSYAAGWRRLTPLFAVRAFRHVPRPVEINPWIDGSGRGTFPNTVYKLQRAADFARRPKEPLVQGGFHNVPSRLSEAPAKTVCCSARDLRFLSDKSIDIVLTDPPYFDNIPYSELSEFFTPWLQLLGTIGEDLNLKRIANESLVGHRKSPETLNRYSERLSDAFAEISRTLKDEGLLIFSYRHSLPQAWLALAKALQAHPLNPTQVLPIPGEAGMGLHEKDGSALWDAVFVFRKFEVSRPVSSELAITEEQEARIVSDVASWCEQLRLSPIPFKEADKSTLSRAMLVAEALSVPSSPSTLSLERLLIETG